MARIVFGVMGDSFGHIYQALAVVHHMPGHEFLFVGGDRAAVVKTMGYDVAEVPMPATHYRDNQVAFGPTLLSALSVMRNRGGVVTRLTEIVKAFDPTLILTSYEYFSPLVARRLGIPCISIDNQHFLTKCVHAAPNGQWLSQLTFAAPLWVMFSSADRYMVNSFFPVTPRDPRDTEVFPPLLNPSIRDIVPTEGEHVLVYQTSPTFERLFDVLVSLPHQFIVYGFGERPSRKNLVFRAPSKERFLEDLSGCRYAIANGGHNVISEALYFGKPVLSFPIHLAYEQFFNAFMLASLRYGDYCLDRSPGPEVFERFEERLDEFRSRITGKEFYGNERMATRLEQIILENGKMCC